MLITTLMILALGASEDPENPPVARVPAPDESVYVVQHRAFSKRGHLEITPFFATPINNRWIIAATPMLALTYHVRENLGIEVIGGYQFNRFSSAQQEVQDREGASPVDAELKWMEWFAGGDIQWAPFYGKLRLVPGILGDYDVYILAGFGVAGTKTPCEAGRTYRNGQGIDGSGFGIQGISGVCPDNPALATLPGGLRFAAQFGAGFRVFFTRYFGMRIEFRDIGYSEMVTRINQTQRNEKVPEVSTDIRHNVMFMLGLSLLL